jgi:uncharacterized protein YgiM (DUF1202 family)
MSFQRTAWIGLLALAVASTSGCSSTGSSTAPDDSSTAGESVDVPMLPMEIVTAQSLNVRAEPTKTGMILGSLKKGTEVRVLEEKDGWKRVQSDGAAPEGWVHGDYLKAHGH